MEIFLSLIILIGVGIGLYYVREIRDMVQDVRREVRELQNSVNDPKQSN